MHTKKTCEGETEMPKKQIDMTGGPLFRNIISYTVPIILTSILQLLFNAADLVVVGNFCGSDSVGAVGATSSLTNLIVNLFIGLSVGVGVNVAHSIGAGEDESVRRTVHTAIPMALIGGLIMAVVGVFISGPMLTLMGTPDGIRELSTVYMRIYFAGAVSILLYNFGASILRAVGDTKRPLLYLAIAGVVNVLLNIIFVTAFDMNVAGVALATMIAQTVSAVLVTVSLIRRRDVCRLILKEMRFYKREFFKILRMGVPTGIQSSLFSISNVIIQSSVNSFGAAAVSGNAAAGSIEGFVYVIMNAFQQTAMNFTGQNVGAGNYRRARSVLVTCILSVVVIGSLSGGLVYAFGEPLLGIYVSDAEEAIAVGMQKLLCVCLPYFLCGIMEVTSGSLRGMGSSLIPMLTAIIGACVFRIVWVYTVFQIFHTPTGLFISYPISWVLTFAANVISFCIVYRKKVKKHNDAQSLVG